MQEEILVTRTEVENIIESFVENSKNVLIEMVNRWNRFVILIKLLSWKYDPVNDGHSEINTSRLFPQKLQ